MPLESHFVNGQPDSGPRGRECSVSRIKAFSPGVSRPLVLEWASGLGTGWELCPTDCWEKFWGEEREVRILAPRVRRRSGQSPEFSESKKNKYNETKRSVSLNFKLEVYFFFLQFKIIFLITKPIINGNRSVGHIQIICLVNERSSLWGHLRDLDNDLRDYSSILRGKKNT